MKRHIWRVSYFFIKQLTKIETLLCFMKRHVWRVSYFFIKCLTKIKTSSIFLNSHQKILENSDFKFLLRKFQNLNFHFKKPYSPNSTIIITTYPCIYLYIQHKRCGESVDHLLLHCPIAYELWSMVFCLFGIHWVMPYHISKLLGSWQGKFGRHRNIDLWKFVPHCLFWCLW